MLNITTFMPTFSAVDIYGRIVLEYRSMIIHTVYRQINHKIPNIPISLYNDCIQHIPTRTRTKMTHTDLIREYSNCMALIKRLYHTCRDLRTRQCKTIITYGRIDLYVTHDEWCYWRVNNTLPEHLRGNWWQIVSRMSYHDFIRNMVCRIRLFNPYTLYPSHNANTYGFSHTHIEHVITSRLKTRDEIYNTGND